MTKAFINHAKQLKKIHHEITLNHYRSKSIVIAIRHGKIVRALEIETNNNVL